MFNQLLLFLCALLFCCATVVAHPNGVALQRRDDNTVSAISKTYSTSPTSASISGSSSLSSATSKTSSTNSLALSRVASATASSSMSTTFSSTASSLPASSVIAISTSTASNSTMTPNALPLTPKITPAFGIAGGILMISGVAYAFIGTRKRLLHVSLSTAYATSLGITVLILHLTHLPISNAVQGAYLVAAVMGGLIFGAGSLVYPDHTQGIGCLLGGYCISMWILTLKAGGLITSMGGKSGFITGCAVVSFAMSFNRHIRPYAMTILVSFSGATAIVLGIDCFSRAGLKEFWAYIWNVNKSIFPSGTTTYPLTYGIKVETGILIVLFFAGMAVQSNILKTLIERREREKEENRTAERAFEIEEENIGRLIEHQNKIDRNEWEAIYGHKKAGGHSKPADSGVGEMESLKRAASTNTSLPNSRDGNAGYAELEAIPMKQPALFLSHEKMGISIQAMRQDLTVMMVQELPGPHSSAPETPTSLASELPNVSVRDFGTLAVSPKPPVALSELSISDKALSQMGSEVGSRAGSQSGSRSNSRRVSRVGSQLSSQSRSQSTSQGQQQSLSRRTSEKSNAISSEPPEIIPLPFKIPTLPTEEEFPDDSSSIATFNDNPEDLRQLVPEPRPRPTQRGSSELMATQDDEEKRLSTMVNIGDDSDIDINEIMVPDQVMEGNVQASSPQRSPTRQSYAKGSSEYGEIEDSHDSIPVDHCMTTPDVVEETLQDELTPASEIQTVEEKILDRSISHASVEEKIVVEEPQEVARPESMHFLPLISPPNALSTAENDAEPEVRPGLSKENLPATVSKVVMSYRTNEWAKHLDTADIPIVEDPNLSPSPTTSEPHVLREVAAPVNVEALQQTPENAAIPPAQIPTTARTSQMPRSQSQPHLLRSDSNNSQLSASSSHRSSRLASKPAFELRGTMNRSSTQSSSPNALYRSSSQTSMHSNYTTAPSRPRENYKRSTSTPVIGPTLIEDPHEDVSPLPGHFSSAQLPYGKPNTLMSQRDTIIRSKSSFRGAINNHALSTPHEDGDDTMSMSARRDRLRQSSLNKLTSAVPSSSRNPPNPARASTAPPPEQKDQMLRMWRSSVQQDLQAGHGSHANYERQRSELWEKKQREAAQRHLEGERVRRSEHAKDERLRRGNLEEAHRMAMRKMQAGANKQL